MSKLFIFGIIVFLTSFNPLISPAHAFFHTQTVTCEDSGLKYEPTFFPENSSSIVLNFTITNSNTLINLRNKYARLNIKRTGQFAYESSPVQITGDKFSLEVTDDGLKQKGRHTGHLHIGNDDKNFSEFCGEIVYQVGATDRCIIDPSLPSTVPLNTTLTIKFFGDANTEYSLRLTQGGTSIATTRTDSSGQGQFDNVLLTGSQGEKLTITILRTGGRAGNPCTKEIQISVTAPRPSPAPSGPVAPSGPGGVTGNKCDPNDPSYIGADKCTSSGDKEKVLCGNDASNPGIRTAIGCIHTSPVGFVQDALKFVIGISGGLAFLMMLLGAFQMLTSAGNPETLQAGRERLTSAIIGLLLVIFAVLLLQIIGVGILNIPGFKP